jgi:hypothetical protein
MTPEKETLTESQDRLIEDETRRMKGEFYTPTVWVDEAHFMIAEQFGSDWKEKYVVWDPACGTGNLTKDYKFKELYCSTLNGSDVETMEQAGYNPEATKFQYDFLNDGITDGVIDVENDSKLPQGLKDVILDGKEIIVFMNPPYGRPTGDGKLGSIKKGSAINEINALMKNSKLNGASSQLYTQFLYKILKINNNDNFKICMFTPPLFLSGSSYKKFRNDFLKKFGYVSGMLFNASHFSDVSDWGLSFTIFNNEETIDKENFHVSIKDTDGADVIVNELKNIYNLDNNKPLNKWIIYNNDIRDYPKLSSALAIKETVYGCGLDNASFSTLVSNSNSVAKNPQSVYIVNGGISENVGKIQVNKNTFKDVVVIFSARRLITGKYANWINWYDEYIAPTEEVQNSDKYKQFESDSIVYSLFESKSNQSSLKQVEYKDKLWDIKNEFFFMSTDEMQSLANDNNFDELYKDARHSDERYVYDLLKSTNLSPDAKDVLDTARELVKKTFEWRKIIHQTNPEYHLDAWDAGWYQIKKVLNEHYKEDLKAFTVKYKAFEDRMRPQVYELGFLKG